MAQEFDCTEENIGRRVQYTGRNGNVKYGVVRGYAANMVDIKIDNSTRPVFYVPRDTVVLVPDNLDI